MLHYLWLVVFMWMLMEGVYLFLKVNPSISFGMKLPICVPVAWGIPAVIAFTTLGIGISKYADPEKAGCWLPLTDGLIYAFVGPALLITVVNLIFLVVVIHTFLSLKTNQEKTEKDRIKASVRAMAILIPLLGLTWIFGVLQLDTASAVVFSYLFNIGNGLQGVFIFITQCLLDDDVKHFLKKKTSRGRVDGSSTTGSTGF
ncbi:adhesion G-protein coupled receptor D1-like [Amphiura filiformis]|uniref:adhesion G-protein coupled receptor D1-like n=1 Tax=Amphiura filiformis TaxID=82378 RepID=UPI003B218E71